MVLLQFALVIWSIRSIAAKLSKITVHIRREKRRKKETGRERENESFGEWPNDEAREG